MTLILVIEDQATVRDNIVEILEIYEFDVIHAENGAVGVELARQHLPDLILCDVMMPQLDGYGTLLALRSEPATSLIPFIFLTAKSDRPSMRYGMELGADDYLTKPFSTEELLAAVNTRLAKQAAITERFDRSAAELRESMLTMLPHELRTPLTGILGYSQMIIEDGHSLQTDDIIRMVETIYRAGQRLHRLVENFLLYAQLEVLNHDHELYEGVRQLTTEKPDLVIEWQAEQQAQQAERPADLQCTLEAVDQIQIAEDYLKKLVSELVNNAFKFSRPGTPVQVSGHVDNNRYILRITDHGRGMTTDEISRIGGYVQFNRKLHEQQGSGLGLVIAKQLAELHGGHLTLDSTPDVKTTVNVALLRSR